MSKHKGPWVVALLLTLLVTACTHKPPPQFHDALAPFTNARDQTLAVVARAKRSLGDKSYDKLMASKQSPIASAWVPSFAQSLQTQSNQYDQTIAKMSPQQKTDLTTTLKRLTVWPNYEDIATESVSSHP